MAIVFIVIALALISFSYRYAWWAPAVDFGRPRILMYHMITDSKPGQKQRGLRVSPREFEKQLEWLKRDGWTFSTMAELMAANGEHPRKTVVLTFDDGFEDNYTAAFPLLKKFGAKATLYLVVDRHNRDWSVYKKAHHNSGELARVPKLSDAQIREMVQSCVFELGGHTMTHINLAKSDTVERAGEIGGCRKALAEQFGCEVTSFAYPFGIYSKADVEAVRAAGFTNAVTTEPGIDASISSNPFDLKRVKVSGKDGMLAFKIRMRCGRKGIVK